MKKTLKIFYFAYFLIAFISCTKDAVEEPIIQQPVEDTEENPEPNEPDPPVVTSCDFNLLNIKEGETITLNCILDLQGKTITLPKNVTLVYDKGDIINGTLNFGNSGKIDGELLNASLSIEGDVQLTSTEFKFIPSRWDIVEGEVNDEIASDNKDKLKAIFIFIKKIGGTKFYIDKMDAYFKVDEPSGKPVPTVFAITFPSNFHLIMTENTHLRMQPNAYKQPVLLSVLSVDNVTIEGGILHGERDEHDYSSGGTHEWPTLISIKASQNIKVTGVTMQDATGDGLAISALGHSWDSHYTQSSNVTVMDNIFLRNRRNQMSITDGFDIVVENNQFIDASIHTDNSQGVAPGFAIDIEPVRGNNPLGPQQIAEKISILNNTERGSRVGGFTVHTGDRVTFEGNTMDNGISYSTATEIIIKNNFFKALSDKAKSNGIAITAGRTDLFDRNFGSKVFGNTITGYSTGIALSNTDLEVFDNKISDCKVGLSIETITKSKVFKNEIISSKDNSDGIVSSAQATYYDQLIVENNSVDVKRFALLIVGINIEDTHRNFLFDIRENLFMKNGATISNTKGFSIDTNTFKNGGIRLVNAEKGSVRNNNINSTTSNGIRIDEGCKDLNITKNNLIIMGRNLECIKVNGTDGVNLTIENNTCN